MDKKSLNNIQRLVGNITEGNLKNVDCYVCPNLGLFIPSVGFCEYAITLQHVHPAYSFVMFFSEEQSILPSTIEVLPNHYLATAMYPYIPHEEKEADSFTRYIAILISSEFYEKQYILYRNDIPEKYFWKQFLINQDIMIYLKKFMNEYENKQSGYENMLESLSTIITHQLIRSILEIKDSPGEFIEKFEIEKVINYMHQNFGKKLTLGELAKIVSMSESHFIRTFKQETQVSPIEYLIKLRIEKGKKLLRDRTMTVTEVALQCGFSSPSHFTSCFVKQIGITPTDYQNLYSK